MNHARFAGICTLAAALGVAGALSFTHSARAGQTPGSCTELREASQGVTYKILFASNGTVQQYVLVTSSHRVEQDHDVRSELEQRYGPEAINAPSLRITAFRKGSGGMMVPDKAVDSCGRTVDFH